MPIIETDQLSKTFVVRRKGTGGGLRKLIRKREEVRAVDGISFQIDRGEMVGYIGPNGAGKSTTVKMLTGILVPSEGHVQVAGLEPSRNRTELARKIGVVFGQRTQLWWDLPLRDSFELLRHIYGVEASRFKANLEEFVELLDLTSILTTPVRQLSLGQRMRGDLAAALLHDPGILFLDEPTVGLDVVAKARIRDFLRKLNRERGVTVLLTTHDMSDIERLSRRILIIDTGRVLYDGPLETIVARFRGESVLVVDLQEAAPPLDLEGAVVERVDGPRQWLRFDRRVTSAASLIAGVAERTSLVDLTIQEPAIEDIVRAIYLDTLGGQSRP